MSHWGLTHPKQVTKRGFFSHEVLHVKVGHLLSVRSRKCFLVLQSPKLSWKNGKMLVFLIIIMAAIGRGNNSFLKGPLLSRTLHSLSGPAAPNEGENHVLGGGIYAGSTEP